MAPPHYEMVSQQYDELCTVYGMICSVDGLAAETCGDISSNAGLVGKMVEPVSYTHLYCRQNGPYQSTTVMVSSFGFSIS